MHFLVVQWTAVTFHQLFVKVNNTYVRFIAQSLPPFAASNNFYGEVCVLYTCQKAVSRLQLFGGWNLTKQREGLSG